MKRISIALLLLVAAMFGGCASYNETWRGPSAKATPACDPTPGLGFQVGGQEFIPVGYYTWTDEDRNTHKEMVYVLRPRKGGAK